MTYKFGTKSLTNLHGVHPHLVMCVEAAMDKQIMDFSVREGVRSLERQKELFKSGASKTMNSKHLIQPDGYGHAVDLYPYPINMDKVNDGNWVEISRFGVLAGIMLSCARELGIKLKWGNDWNGDGQTLDHSFHDAPHFELIT